ncbi:copper chaperone [Leucobacter sp. OH2974_COT-288]|uniref:Copper chaperone CopZ n=1 Tax=Canibacter oris TaxID=1365628 RepID=A0A840DHF2_9MICO|nr:heavy-metal-associated domain-containing protein [Canibacter oris]MBB4072160.1 copper chaperone CopZ [Canibacter oris]RRD35626.1 copper chaperone [Leucobacter sp. OH2974_COT-288]
METVTFTVTGMSCGHCEKAIRTEVSQLPGVQQLAVSSATGSLSVTGTALDANAIIAAVAEAGYEAVRA